MTYITRSAPRCVACRQPEGAQHAPGCQLAKFVIRRAQ